MTSILVVTFSLCQGKENENMKVVILKWEKELVATS